VRELSSRASQQAQYIPNSVYANAWASQSNTLLICLNATTLQNQSFINRNQFAGLSLSDGNKSVFDQTKTYLNEDGQSGFLQIISVLQHDQMNSLVDSLREAYDEELTKFKNGEYDRKPDTTEWKLPIDPRWNLPADLARIYKAQFVNGMLVLIE
jgi:hypothetical protein